MLHWFNSVFKNKNLGGVAVNLYHPEFMFYKKHIVLQLQQELQVVFTAVIVLGYHFVNFIHQVTKIVSHSTLLNNPGQTVWRGPVKMKIQILL